MTVLETMTERALAEFDRLAALREEQVRLAMAHAGRAKPEIDAAIEECRPSIAEQRALIPDHVESALRRAGVPSEVQIDG